MSIEQQAAEVIDHETRAPGASITRGKDRAILAAILIGAML